MLYMEGGSMKYFLLKSDPKYTDMPWVKTIPKEIDVRNIRIEEAHKLPMVTMVSIHESAYTDFIDVISSPFLLFSEKCMKVIKLYEPYILSKFIGLFDSKNHKKETYHLPILPRIDCVTKECKIKLNKQEMQLIELDLSQIGKHAIFQIDDVNFRYVVIRLDIVESMLKREARGLHLTELKTISE